jgi:outer membrane immunogenic protein
MHRGRKSVGVRISKCLVFATVGLSSGIAAAADLRPEPGILEPAPVARWNGLYAGVFTGAGSTRFTSSQVDTSSVSKNGLINGSLAGWNTSFGQVVFGAEADLGLHIIRAENHGSAGLIAHGSDNLYAAHLRGRLGYDLGRFLPFVAGGATYQETYVRRSAPFVDQGSNRTTWGWNIGAGLDTQVDLPFVGPVVLRGEVLHDWIPSATYGLGPGVDPVRSKQSTNYFRLAIIAPSWIGTHAPASIPAAQWAGAYVGLKGAYAAAHVDNGGGDTFDASGFAGGLYTGRNFVFGNVVAGYEGSIGLSDWRGTGPAPGIARLSYRDYIEADFRGRVGYAFGPVLPFFAAGISWGRSEQIDETTLAQRGRFPTHALSLGAGVDYMFAPGWSARLEYVRDVHLAFGTDNLVDLNGTGFKQSRSVDSVRMGVAYHFN